MWRVSYKSGVRVLIAKRISSPTLPFTYTQSELCERRYDATVVLIYLASYIPNHLPPPIRPALYRTIYRLLYALLYTEVFTASYIYRAIYRLLYTKPFAASYIQSHLPPPEHRAIYRLLYTALFIASCYHNIWAVIFASHVKLYRTCEYTLKCVLVV